MNDLFLHEDGYAGASDMFLHEDGYAGARSCMISSYKHAPHNQVSF